MKVYSLVGKSGTGKSYQAINLCKTLEIESIIDDGLFIFGSTILGGISAKSQETKTKAIKTALFMDDNHRDEIQKKIREVSPEAILILGTSDRMIEKITEKLELPKPEKTIYINEITTEEERKIADKQRHEHGKHIIPAPTVALKKEFSGYFMHPLRLLKDFIPSKSGFTDRSVVRPTYSYLGQYNISKKAVYDIVTIAGSKVAGILEIYKIDAYNEDLGLVIQVSAILKYGVNLIKVTTDLQENIFKTMETMTAFNIKTIDVEIKTYRGE